MLALLSVWTGLAVLALALAMLFYPPAFTSVTLPLVLYIGSPAALWLSGVTWWIHRRDRSGEPGVAAQRTQAAVGAVLALAAAAIVYYIILTSPGRGAGGAG